MNRVEAALRGIATDLDVLHVRWALVGGFAVSVRTEPRFTRDVDVAVLVDGDPAAERLVRSLVGAGYRLDAIIEQDVAGMPVATAGHLVALKLLARDDQTRPQDAADLRALHAVLGAADRAAARTAAALIVERGFARGRPLTALTEAFLGG